MQFSLETSQHNDKFKYVEILEMNMEKKSFCIVVLGDVGRSPRMQYHAKSLAEEGHKVDIVGYHGAAPITSLIAEPLVSFHYLNPYPNIPLPRFLNYFVKTLWQAVTLLFVLMIIRTPDFLLVQNPPAVPALLVCYIHKLFCGAKLVIDWHNYAYTIMSMSVGPQSILVSATEKIEEFVGRKADYNFCVTKQMKVDLMERWNISAVTLYDRPPDIFMPISLKEKHDVVSRLGKNHVEFTSNDEADTVFTTVDETGVVALKVERPGLLISSTSWTEDEDFSVLLSALQDYEDSCEDGNPRKLPKLICVITGKGPMKEYYCKKVEEAHWKHVAVLTPWLETCDYPLLLASADLGVCLHTSSSGLDLPMKVVDMFGCGLPVCAYNFKCLHELVKNNVNGFTFEDAQELSGQIQGWFEHFPNNAKQQEQAQAISKELEKFQQLRWTENWKLVVIPFLK